LYLYHLENRVISNGDTEHGLDRLVEFVSSLDFDFKLLIGLERFLVGADLDLDLTSKVTEDQTLGNGSALLEESGSQDTYKGDMSFCDIDTRYHLPSPAAAGG
jgi:hypothetical protein